MVKNGSADRPPLRRSKAAAARRAARRRRQRPVWLAAGVVALAAVILIVVVVSGGGATKTPAGTTVFAESNHEHVTGTVQYDRVPPAGGAHNAVWLNCGVYTQPVANENAVHSLEHGAVWITYTPSLPSASITTLQHFVESHYVSSQRYLVLSPYPGLPTPVVASAWGAQLRLNDVSDPRLAAFVTHYAGGGQGGEKGGECTGGTASPTG